MANKSLKKLLAVMCAAAITASAAPGAVFADGETEPAAQDVAAVETAAEPENVAADAEETVAEDAADAEESADEQVIDYVPTDESIVSFAAGENTVEVYYNEDFSDTSKWTEGVVVSANNSSVSNTKDWNDWHFEVATRGSGGDRNSLRINNGALQAYRGERNSEAWLTKTGLDSPTTMGVIKMNFSVNTSSTATLKLSDGTDSVGTNTISLNNANFGIVSGQRYTMELALNNPGTSAIMIIYSDNNSDGAYGSGDELVYYDPAYATAAKSLTRIDFPGKEVGGGSMSAAIYSFYYADETYKIPTAIILEGLDLAALSENEGKLTADTSQANKYTAMADFTLPSEMEGLALSWETDNTDAVAIEGNTAVIHMGAQSQTATLTVTADGSQKQFTIVVPDASVLLQTAADSLKLSGDNVRYDDTESVYRINGSFEVPALENGITYTWTASNAEKLTQATSGDKVTFTPAVYDDGEKITLTVVLEYNGATVSKTFDILLDSTRIYYDESFDSWSGGQTLVKLNDVHEYTGYDGWIFKVGSRSDGGNGGVYTISGDNGDVYLGMNAAYGDSSRYPRSILTKCPAAGDLQNTLVANFKMQLANTECVLTLDDGDENGIGTNTIELSKTMCPVAGKWYDVTVALNNPGTSAEISVLDTDGNVVYYTSAYATALKKISSMDFNMRSDNYIYINDFTLKDIKYTTDPKVVVAAAADSIDIPGDSNNKSAVTTAANEGDDFLAISDFKVPTSNSGATITWSCEDSHITMDNTTGTATVNPEAGYTGPVTIKAVVAYGGETKEVSYKVELQDPQAVVDAAELSVVNVLDYKKQGEVQVDLKDSTTPIMYDLYLPTTGDTNVQMSWKISEDIYTITGEDAVLMLKDTNAHNVTITNTVSYVKNGAALATKEYSYPVTVQFNKDAATAKAQAAAEAAAEKQNAKDPDAETKATAADYIDAYMKALLYNYQVRFDAAYDANFSSVPTASIPTSTNAISLPNTGLFGSTIAWESNNSAVKVQNSSGTATVSHPSSTTSVTLTASIGVGTAEPEKKSFTVSVTGKGSNGGGGGGSGSGSGGTTGRTGGTTVLTTPSPTTTPEPDSSNPFTDIDNVKSWAGDAITKLYKNGIIAGRSETIFDPDAPVTRAEFIKMLIGTLKIDSSVVTTPIEFKDLDENHWAYDVIQIAAAAGIVNGYEDGSFGVNDNIFRQDMAVILKRAADYVKLTLPQVNEKADFTDETEIGDYADDAVTALQEADIINGNDDGSFNPHGAANRAQAAKVLASDVFWN